MVVRLDVLWDDLQSIHDKKLSKAESAARAPPLPGDNLGACPYVEPGGRFIEAREHGVGGHGLEPLQLQRGRLANVLHVDVLLRRGGPAAVEDGIRPCRSQALRGGAP
ncbi:MAG: alpha,alpha-trehalase [Desulfobacterales bacterium]|nr:alpha,alpha-trehalase [Desulfobacterales bacterium]